MNFKLKAQPDIFICHLYLTSKGNQDLCYHNYLCAIPYNVYVKDVNHIISNCGYIIFGVFFVFIVQYKDTLYKSNLETDEICKGLPQYFGIFYALGYSLITIGFLSMCYHGCPTNENFQFDTTFMYVVAILLILKIYQFRHPDVTSSANKIFFGISLVLLLEIIGIHCSGTKKDHPERYTWFWVVLSILYICFILKLAPIMYKSGTWSRPSKECNLGFIVSFNILTY